MSALNIFTAEYQMGPQKQTYQSYSSQPTCPPNKLQLTQLVQRLQQPYPWCITVSFVQHTSSNTHDTKEIQTRNGCKLDIFSPCRPAEIDSNTLLTFKLHRTNKSHNSNEFVLIRKKEIVYSIRAELLFIIIITTYVMILQ